MWHWAGHYTSLGISFRICKMGIALYAAAVRINERNALVCVVPPELSPPEGLSE